MCWEFIITATWGLILESQLKCRRLLLVNCLNNTTFPFFCVVVVVVETMPC